MLPGPKTVNEVADLFNKILLSVCTLSVAIAGFLLNESIDDGNRRRELYTFLSDAPTSASSPDELRRVGFLKSVCRSYLKRVADEGARALCTSLPERPSQKTVSAISADTAGPAQELVRTGDAAGYLGSQAAADQNSLVAASGPTLDDGSQLWFAVVGTIPVNQPEAAKRLAEELRTIIPANVLGGKSIKIYRTQISNSYAVTVGDGMSKTEAVALANRLRGVAALSDAFAQPNRNWTLWTPSVGSPT